MDRGWARRRRVAAKQMGRDANGSRWEPGLAAGVKAEKLRNRMWKYFVCSFVSFLPLVNMQGSNQEIGFRWKDRLGVDPIDKMKN